MTLNPKDYRIRIYLKEGHPQNLPHNTDLRPERMQIQYRELRHESQTLDIHYYGLWVQRNIYQKVELINGKPQFVNLITKGNFYYTWDDNNQCSLQNLAVFYCLRDGSFDPKPELYPHHFVEPSDKNKILKGRRSKIIDDMTSKAIALKIGEYSIPFFKLYSELTNNYISSGDTELIETLQAIAPLPTNDPNQQNWLFKSVPKSEPILASLTQEQKDYLEVSSQAEILTIKEVLILNFWMATKIPSPQEIASYLSVAGV